MKVFINKYLPANSFARGVAVLSGGTAGAQILLLIAAPILTRIYSPEDFGILAVFVSLLSILAVVVSLRYELAIPIADDDQTALNVVVLCLLITTGMTILTALFVWLIGGWLAILLNLSKVTAYLELLPVGIFLIGIYQTFNYWATREKAFGRISKTKLMQSVSSLIVQFSCFKLGPLGLIIGYIAGQCMGAGRLAKPALANLELHNIKLMDIKNAGIRYICFPQFSTWAGLVNTCGSQFAPLMLASFFGVGVAGWYALANRVVAIPSMLIGSAVGNVFFAHAADAKKENKLAALVEDVQSKLIALGLPVAMIVVISGPEIFIWLFGSDWHVAGQFTQWLALSSFAGFLISSISVIFPVLEKQKLGLILQLSLFTFRLAGLVVGLMHDDYLMAIMLYAIGGVCGYSLYVIAINTCSGASGQKFFKNFLNYGAIATLICMPIIMSERMGNLTGWTMVSFLSTLVLLGIYYFYLSKKFLYS